MKDDNGRLTRSMNRLTKERKELESNLLECLEHVDSKIAQAMTLLEEAREMRENAKDIVLKTNPI